MTDAFYGILIPFLGTSLGAASVFFLKKSLGDYIQRALTGFAAGVMVAASIWSLLIPAMDQSEALGKLAFFPAVVGFWTDKGKADESTSDFLKQLRGKRVFLFGTAGFGGSEEYFNKILKAVQKDLHSSNTVIGSFMCQGKMPMSVRQRYENMKKQPLHLPNLDAMIENFDKALSHPDADDLERLKQAVK